MFAYEWQGPSVGRQRESDTVMRLAGQVVRAPVLVVLQHGEGIARNESAVLLDHTPADAEKEVHAIPRLGSLAAACCDLPLALPRCARLGSFLRPSLLLQVYPFAFHRAAKRSVRPAEEPRRA